MMTSIADKYYRKINNNIDNVRMKFDISALLKNMILKLMILKT